MALVAMTALSIVLVSTAEELARFMIDDPEVVQLTVAFIYIIAIVQPIMACEFTLSGALRGAGDTRFPLMATLCGIFLGRLIPAGIVAALGLSVYWIFAVMILDYGIKAALLITRFRSGKWLDIRLSTSKSPPTT
jgi:Na+-driven multidrug efflux pump